MSVIVMRYGAYKRGKKTVARKELEPKWRETNKSKMHVGAAPQTGDTVTGAQ